MKKPVRIHEKIKLKTRDEIFKRIEHERKKLDNPHIDDIGRHHSWGVVHALAWVTNMDVIHTEELVCGRQKI